MRISEIAVQNLGCLAELRVRCDSLTVLVGRNGSGKSTLLRGLQLFYTAAAEYSVDDYYAGRIEQPIVVAITFENLSPDETDTFGKYVDAGQLRIEKRLTWPKNKTSQKYFGARMACAGFADVRRADTVQLKRQMYRQLRDGGTYGALATLPGNASGDRIEAALSEWERAHPETLVRSPDDGQFFGFKEVGQARLERHTTFLLVPAVRDAALDGSEGKGRALTELLDVLVRTQLGQRPDLQALQNDYSRRLTEIVSPEGGLPELNTLEADLKNTLRRYAPGAGLSLEWRPPDPPVMNLPKANVRLEEDGYACSVDRVGHGLQRAFLLTVLQQLSQLRPAEAGHPPAGLVLAIEEAELYQHPSRQRHLASVLKRLVEDPPPALSNLQVIYSTHSPLLVDLERFDRIRVLRKTNTPGAPQQSRVCASTLASVVQRKEECDGVPRGTYRVEAERMRLKTLMNPWTNEGFFARQVLLVEGEEDRAVLLASAALEGLDLEAADVAIIPCGGKPNVPKAALVFSGFEIPLYIVWDGDRSRGVRDGNPAVNRSLLTLLRQPPVDFPPTQVGEHFACFEENLTTTLMLELGELVHRACLDEAKREFGIANDDDARKSPLVVNALLTRASERGARSETVRAIVRRVVTMANGTTHAGT